MTHEMKNNRMLALSEPLFKKELNTPSPNLILEQISPSPLLLVDRKSALNSIDEEKASGLLANRKNYKNAGREDIKGQDIDILSTDNNQESLFLECRQSPNRRNRPKIKSEIISRIKRKNSQRKLKRFRSQSCLINQSGHGFMANSTSTKILMPLYPLSAKLAHEDNENLFFDENLQEKGFEPIKDLSPNLTCYMHEKRRFEKQDSQ